MEHPYLHHNAYGHEAYNNKNDAKQKDTSLAHDTAIQRCAAHIAETNASISTRITQLAIPRKIISTQNTEQQPTFHTISQLPSPV